MFRMQSRPRVRAFQRPHAFLVARHQPPPGVDASPTPFFYGRSTALVQTFVCMRSITLRDVWRAMLPIAGLTTARNRHWTPPRCAPRRNRRAAAARSAHVNECYRSRPTSRSIVPVSVHCLVSGACSCVDGCDGLVYASQTATDECTNNGDCSARTALPPTAQSSPTISQAVSHPCCERAHRSFLGTSTPSPRADGSLSVVTPTRAHKISILFVPSRPRRQRAALGQSPQVT